MKFIAYTVKGLEQIAKNEITKVLKNSKMERVGDKFIVFEAELKNIDVNKLRAVDDIGLLIHELEKPKKLNLEEFIKSIEGLDLSPYFKQLKFFKDINNTFSITLSISGLRLNKSELEEKLIVHINEKYTLQHTPQNHSNFDIRIFLNRKVGFVSVRLTKEPLYKREYKEYSSMGSLRPTVASAMIQSLIINEDSPLSKKIVDNFCGSGTILAEAYLLNFDIYGGDIKAENVLNTQRNLYNLGFKNKEKIKNLDATNTNWESNYFDYAASNLPWDKQIEVNKITDLYIKTLEEYKRILKQNGSLCLLVHKPQILIKYAKKYFPGHKIESTKISFKGQTPTIVVIKPNLLGKS